jgi:hypothetical protein
MGVLFFLINVIFASVLIGIFLWRSVSAIVSRNPESRYQLVQDDRRSFMNSQSNLNTELDALGAIARANKTRMAIDDDQDTGTIHVRLSAGTTVENYRDSRARLVSTRTKSPFPSNGFESPARAVSPPGRGYIAPNWKAGVGY